MQNLLASYNNSYHWLDLANGRYSTISWLNEWASHKFYGVCTINIHILQMKTFRLTEVRQFARCHTVNIRARIRALLDSRISVLNYHAIGPHGTAFSYGVFIIPQLSVSLGFWFHSSLRFHSYTIHSKCTIQWFLVYSELHNQHHNQF